MSLDELQPAVLGLDETQFNRFLIRLSHSLTIAGRASYRPEPAYDEAAFARLQIVNELLHTVGNKQLRDFGGGLDLPRETFWTILTEVAGPRGAEMLTWSVENALRRVS